MRKIISRSVLTVMAVFSVLALSQISYAQQPDWARGRNNRRSVDRIIKNVENRTDRFVSQFDNALDNSRLDGSRREDNLNARAKQLERATNELRNDFNRRGNNWWETKSNVQNCLSLAADINTAMVNHRFNRRTENNWRNVRKELNNLAQAYNLPPMGAYR